MGKILFSAFWNLKVIIMQNFTNTWERLLLWRSEWTASNIIVHRQRDCVRQSAWVLCRQVICLPGCSHAAISKVGLSLLSTELHFLLHCLSQMPEEESIDILWFSAHRLKNKAKNVLQIKCFHELLFVYVTLSYLPETLWQAVAG